MPSIRDNQSRATVYAIRSPASVLRPVHRSQTPYNSSISQAYILSYLNAIAMSSRVLSCRMYTSFVHLFHPLPSAQSHSCLLSHNIFPHHIPFLLRFRAPNAYHRLPSSPRLPVSALTSSTLLLRACASSSLIVNNNGSSSSTCAAADDLEPYACLLA